MAESKKKDTKKIIDVSHPGKTAPSGNSKSVIVSSRPIMKDPMVTENNEDKVMPESGEKPKGKIKLEKADDKKTIAALAEEAAGEEEKAKATNREKVIAPITEDSKDEKVSKEKSEVPETEDDPKSDEEPKEEVKEDAKSDDVSQDPEDKEKSDEISENEAEIEAAEAEKHDKEVQKLIDDKKYYLPINTVEKRRSKRAVVLGVIITLLMVAIWADISLDAGLVEVSGVPHTHLFDQQAVATTNAAPPLAYKTYTTKVSNLKFRYPVVWGVIDSNSETSDAILFSPKVVNDDGEAGITSVALTSPAQDIANQSVSTIKYVKYQKLSHQIGGTVYLRDMVYQGSTGAIFVKSSLTNSNKEKIGDPVPTNNSFLNADGKSTTEFTTVVYKTTKNKPGFATVKGGQNFISTPNYQKARAMLLSTTSN